MACTGRYAEAWQYAAMWCKSSLLSGVHGGAGPVDAVLVDTTVDFIAAGAVAGTGQILYNTTQSTQGAIVAATTTTLTATGVTWNAGDVYQSVFLETDERSAIEHYLNIAAGPIAAALMAVNACNCTYGDGGAFLAFINIILARVLYDCPCSNSLTEREKELYSSIASSSIDKIENGTIDVCAGQTGSLFPSLGYAQQGWTEFNQAQIILRDIMRNTP